MQADARCAVHPAQPADGTCARCRHPFCAECLRDWEGRSLCAACRQIRIRKRLLVAGIVTVMVSVPAAVIAWSLWSRLGGDEAPRRTETARRAGPEAARLARAEAMIKAGHRAQARALLQGILARDPRHLGALNRLARMAREEDRPREVLRLTSRILLVAPGSVDARLWQAAAYERLAMPAKAEATLRQGLTAAPRSARLALAFADQLAQQGRHREAALLLRRVLERGPDGQRERLRARLKRLEAQLP